MDDKRRKRYIIAVYSIVALIGVIFILVGVFGAGGAWQSVILNLGTEFLGVVVISLLLMFFLLQDWQLSERVERILTRLKSLERTSAHSFFREAPELGKHIQSATRIDLAGVTLTATLDAYRQDLLDALRRGAHLRLLVMDATPENLSGALHRSPARGSGYFQRRLEETSDHLNWLYANWKSEAAQKPTTVGGNLEVGLLSYVPGVRIDAFDTQDVAHPTADGSGIVFVEIYAQNIEINIYPRFQLTLDHDAKWYRYFVKQYDAMWQVAQPWSPWGGSHPEDVT